MKCPHSHPVWVRALRLTPVRGAGVCDALYVTMSQASSEPAGHDQMDQSNPVLRDPYITCCYSAAQTPPVTFTLFLFKEI